MFHLLAILSLLASKTCDVAAVTLDSTLITQLGYDSQSLNAALYRKNITDIDLNAFKGYVNLKNLVNNLVLTSNNISKISAGTFNNVNITQTLDLSYNRLTKIENDTFVGLNELASIYLINNKISTIETGAFNGMTNLQIILLDRNNLTLLDSSIFAGLNNLQLISLYNNPYLQKSNLQSLCPTTAVKCKVNF